MGSLEGLQKAAAPEFFYTRLTGRMQEDPGQVRKPFLLLRPAFVTAALSLVLVVNIISLMKLDKQPVQTNKPATIESFATAYSLNTDAVYE